MEFEHSYGEEIYHDEEEGELRSHAFSSSMDCVSGCICVFISTVRQLWKCCNNEDDVCVFYHQYAGLSIADIGLQNSQRQVKDIVFSELHFVHSESQIEKSSYSQF